MQKLRQSSGQIGRKTPRSIMGLQDHQTCSDRRNLVLVGIGNISDHFGRHQHADTPSGRSGPRPERRSTPLDAGSLGGKATTGPNSHRGLLTANPGRTPQKNKGLGITNRKPDPEVRDSNYATEGPRETGTQLGRTLHHHRSGRQGVIHLVTPRFQKYVETES